MDETTRKSYAIHRKLHQLLHNNKKLRQQLLAHNHFDQENLPLNLLRYFKQHSPKNWSPQMAEELERELSKQTALHQHLSKLISFKEREQTLLRIEAEAAIEQQGLTYGYLRSQWSQYRINNDLEVDDKIDRLNKVIAKLKNKTSQQIKAASEVQLVSQQQRYSDDYIDNLHRNFERLNMQKQQLESRMHQVEQKFEDLKAENDKLHLELTKSKQKIKAFENKYIQGSKKIIQLEETLLNINSQSIKNKKHGRLLYTNKEEQFTVEVKGQAVTYKDDISIEVSLEQLKDFLSKEHQNSPLRELISIRNLDKTERVIDSTGTQANIAKDKMPQRMPIEPVRIVVPEGYGTPQMNNCSVLHDNNKPLERKQLTRQGSSSNLKNSSSQGLLKRSGNYVASASKLGYIRQPSRDKNSEIQKNFYVKMDAFDKI